MSGGIVLLELPRENGREGSHLLNIMWLPEDDGSPVVSSAEILFPRKGRMLRREVWLTLSPALRCDLRTELRLELDQRARYAQAECRDLEGRL